MYDSFSVSTNRRALMAAIVAFAVAIAFAVFAPPAAASEDDDSHAGTTYRVTIENLTGGQPLTPVVVATHDDDFRLFRTGRAASNGIRQLAENGGVPVLVSELEGNEDVGSVSVIGSAPILPGAVATGYVMTSDDDDRISLAAMLVCTNDGFAGRTSLRAPERSGSRTVMVRAFDAGTEINTQDVDDLVPPCDGDLTTGTGMSNPALFEDGVVKPHRGIRAGVGDLTPAEHGWTGPVARVTIERVATYEITVENLTTGQPITPAVVAAHRGRHVVFQKGATSSTGIMQLAENGGVPVLASEVAANADVAASAVIGETPIGPGGSATGELIVVGRANRVSLAAMLVCTNDGFAGIDGKRLPSEVGEDNTIYARAFDAGTEINTEDVDDLVPPCDGDSSTGTGVSDPALAEGGVIHRHAGIEGVGDLGPEFDWDGPVVRVTITRVG